MINMCLQKKPIINILPITFCYKKFISYTLIYSKLYFQYKLANCYLATLSVRLNVS